MKSVFSRTLFSLFILCFFLSDSISYAAQATLVWDPPVVSTDVTGYIINYGTTSEAYSQHIDVGNTTSYTVSNLIDGQIYYFAATAYNHAGQKSGYSNEVSNGTTVKQKQLAVNQQYLLLISKPGKGAGTVSGAGINCGNTCLASYNPGTIVSLSATPAPGSTFVGWSGGDCSGTGLCVTTINKATTIKATFDIRTFTFSTFRSHVIVITATVKGTGGAISPSGTSSVGYRETKTFIITPNTDYRIADVIVDGKSVGAVSSYTFSKVVTNHTIAAIFKRHYSLSIRNPEF